MIPRIIVWDMDGTLSYDDGKYDHPKEWTPLAELLNLMANDTYHILVTGSDQLEQSVREKFNKVITRPFPLEPYNTYYSRYFQWKIDTIKEIQPALVFDDDQQICRALLARGIKAIWVPQYSYIPKIPFKEEK